METDFKNGNRKNWKKEILLRKLSKIIKTAEEGIRRGPDLEDDELLLVRAEQFPAA